ncbi:MAG: hypothetical protein ACREEM_08655 [Blastocatellia bacterium]
MKRLILSYALLMISLSSTCSFAAYTSRSSPAQAGTVYPILDARYSYAAERHSGEARLGNVGAFPSSSKSEMRLRPVCEGSGEANRCWLRFEYAFRDADIGEEFMAAFFGLGRTGISIANPDCASATDLDLRQDSPFDLTDLMQNAQDDKVSIESLRLVLRPDGRNQTLTLRIELEDQNRRKKFIRVPLAPGANLVTLNLPLNSFRDPAPAPVEFDWKAVKVAALVIEERHVVDGVSNPPEGRFDIELIGLVDENGPRLEADAIASLSGRELVAEFARRDFESLLRLVDAKTGASLDRTLFRDLIHWGATGWLLAALPAAAGQGWISADDARQRALRILRFVDNDAVWGNEPMGKLGNSIGVMYRFGGIDPQGPFGPLTGTRKIDAGDCNAIEASVIDTALFQFGAATCAAGFSGQDSRDQEITQRVRNILNRTRWDELVDRNTGQLQLGWKPARDTTAPGFFAAPTAFGGFWASRDAQGLSPLTIDYWTDEGAMAAILAAGSETAPAGRGPWYGMLRGFGRGIGRDVVVTCPGAWFTYSFLTATYLDPNLGTDHGAPPVNWPQNAARAFAAYQSSTPPILPDAVELPDTTYLAQGLPDLSVNLSGCGAGFTGTHTPWSLQLAIGLGGETAARAIADLQSLLRNRPELWDPMFGFLDSYHPNLAAFPGREKLSRQEGRWVQQSVWPLNKGGALLAQLNYLADGIVWKTANQHAAIRRGVAGVYQQPCQPCLGPNGQIGPLLGIGRDWWGIAISGRRILLPDGFQELLEIFDDCRRPIKTLAPHLMNAECGSVGESPGPAGVRDAAAHPDGGWVVLIAGPGKDRLLRVQSDLGTLSVLSCDFGEAMTRGDEVNNFPRIAIGGSPTAILVTTTGGIAVVRMDGRLIHTIAPGRRYHGVTVATGTNRLYLLSEDGAIWRYENFYDAAGQPVLFTRLPGSVGGRDLGYNSAWRTTSPNLIAVGTDENVYAIDLPTGRVERLTLDFLSCSAINFQSCVFAVDFEQSLAAFARDETAWLDDGNPIPVVSAASFTPNIADKAIVAAFGAGLAASTQAATSLPLPTTLAGTTVRVNGRAAPLFFVSPNQVNFQIPAGTALGNAAVAITCGDSTSAPATIFLMATATAIFTANAAGTGAAAAVDALTGAPAPFNARQANGQPNIISVFGTGLGGDATDVDGNVNASVTARIDGNPVTLQYAGRAPGFIGLNQFNVVLPASITSGNHTLTLTRGGVTSNSVTIAIR